MLHTDEKMWELHAGGFNRQNTRLRATSAAEIQLIEKDQCPRKIHVWVDVSVNGLSDLVFLDCSVESNSYYQLLKRK